jgi:ATP-dependent RNA helicase DDX46/PRP5
MKKGAEIIVCTPGRMIDLLTANSGRVTNLKRVTYIVLDEADRMFDMGFEPQVMKIMNNIRPDRQTVLFSATFPKQMDGLARKILRKPLEITVGGRSVVAPEIEQVVEVRAEDTKFNRLLEILGQMYNEDPECRTLIFVDRQEAADNLLRELLRRGYLCMSLHGGKEQVDRDQTIADFKSGVVPVVIATSVAARGLDVKQLKLVVNYDAPNHMEDYVHRAGRTGRAGNKGTCVTFITTDQERYSVDIYRALKASNANVPKELEDLANGQWYSYSTCSPGTDHHATQASWRRSRPVKRRPPDPDSEVKGSIVSTRSATTVPRPSARRTANRRRRRSPRRPRPPRWPATPRLL